MLFLDINTVSWVTIQLITYVILYWLSFSRRFGNVVKWQYLEVMPTNCSDRFHLSRLSIVLNRPQIVELNNFFSFVILNIDFVYNNFWVAPLNTQWRRIWRKVLIGTVCFNIRFSGSLCLPCYVQVYSVKLRK